ncbi:hypothetical protein ACFQZQ_13150 [Lysobacter koreensis]|uniref:Uncharacterized protein n=1 Tax=Lysobacter koreensis TaxID=266122 RepID=A0ABW2YPQ5_9GAMM
MNGLFKHAGLACCLIAALTLPGCKGCAPIKAKTVELLPSAPLKTGTKGTAGLEGACLRAGKVPPSSFAPAANEMLVGFDNFFRKGTPPLPCHDIRVAVFRGGVVFDLSQFDSVASARLRFDVARSVSRSGGETVSSSPPKSHATTLGMATQPFSSAMNFDNEATLPSAPNLDLMVSSQVRSWVDKERPNFGFVVAGPTGLPDKSNLPRNNDAQVTFYRNFRLEVMYNPERNPRAPQ